MKYRNWFASLLLCMVFGTVCQSGLVCAADGAKAPAIYDESADGSKQIAVSLVIAKKEGKNVLLMFGANWCPWCHMLHSLFSSDAKIADELKSKFVVVLIDVNGTHNKSVSSQYGNPTRLGLPVLVILNGDGNQLTTKRTGELEEGNHHNPEKVLAFLKAWEPKK